MTRQQFAYREFKMANAIVYKGIKCAVKAQDSGLTCTYYGIVEPIDEEMTQVGEDKIYNECIRNVLHS